MKIVGYFKRGCQDYVAFIQEDKFPFEIKVTDGFHDNGMTPGGDVSNLKNYREVEKSDINLKKIISRMRGTRPWHPLLEVLRKEDNL